MIERSYKSSQRKWLYRLIAVKHFTSPKHVYELAHGYFPLSHEWGIMKDLVKYGILVDNKIRKEEED